jgi:hypothetical protein
VSTLVGFFSVAITLPMSLGSILVASIQNKLKNTSLLR